MNIKDTHLKGNVKGVVKKLQEELQRKVALKISNANRIMAERNCNSGAVHLPEWVNFEDDVETLKEAYIILCEEQKTVASKVVKEFLTTEVVRYREQALESFFHKANLLCYPEVDKMTKEDVIHYACHNSPNYRNHRLFNSQVKEHAVSKGWIKIGHDFSTLRLIAFRG